MAATEGTSATNVEEILAAKSAPLDGVEARAVATPPGLAPTLLTSKAVVISDAMADKIKAAKQESSKRLLCSRIASFGSATTTAGLSPPKLSEADEEEDEESDDEQSGGDNASGEHASDTEATALAATAPTAEGASEHLPSLGSGLHAAGKCSPCYFHLKRRCRNGSNCQFCHLQHERRSRARGCRGHGTSRVETAPLATPPGFAPSPGLFGAGRAGAATLLSAVTPPGLMASVVAPPGLMPSARPPVMAPPGLGAPADAFQAAPLARAQPPEQPRGLSSAAPEFFPSAPPASPGGAALRAAALPTLSEKRGSVAAAGAAAVAAALRTLASPAASAPPQQPAARKTSLLATQPLNSWPPTPQPVQPSPLGAAPGTLSWPQTPIAEGHMMDFAAGASEMPSTPTAPILSTAPAPELPRLLGRPVPKHLAEAAKSSMADDLFVAETPSAAADGETPTTPSSEPAKVLMSSYGGKVPPLDPTAPVKKRVPEWSM